MRNYQQRETKLQLFAPEDERIGEGGGEAGKVRQRAGEVLKLQKVKKNSNNNG